MALPLTFRYASDPFGVDSIPPRRATPAVTLRRDDEFDAARFRGSNAARLCDRADSRVEAHGVTAEFGDMRFFWRVAAFGLNVLTVRE